MIFGAIPDEPSVRNPSSVRGGIGAIAVLCLVLSLVWYYSIHFRHDPYFAAMWTPAILVGIGFAGWGAFFPSAYPLRLLEGSPQLKRLKQWRVGLILSAVSFLVAGPVYVVVSNSARFLDLFEIPSCLCVSAWITMSVYINARTSSYR